MIYLGLAVLGLYMLYRALWLLGYTDPQQDRKGQMGDVGFTLVSLRTGFTVMAAIDLGALGWAAAVLAVSATAAGIWYENRLKAGID